MRRAFKRLFGLGLLAGLAYGLWRAWNSLAPKSDNSLEWGSAPFPFPPEPRPATTASSTATATAAAPPTSSAAASTQVAWVEPNGDGTCPATHPTKAKVKSGIYHEPGGANYDRTKPDRCYVDAAAAEADGLRRSKV
jgi:hypothetical protein